ncbi:hypothetical protein Nepgr_006596 [Nepenthes gracilis]|uniref:Uncharacterized protein n=1 Tax=Nepenthes gracilis TaxID=150966 RepID=A0AAD3XHR5_NEPGR|nr:hypothetical protein Nepgr_006596 [Nepenthes gracilis]
MLHSPASRDGRLPVQLSMSPYRCDKAEVLIAVRGAEELDGIDGPKLVAVVEFVKHAGYPIMDQSFLGSAGLEISVGLEIVGNDYYGSQWVTFSEVLLPTSIPGDLRQFKSSRLLVTDALSCRMFALLAFAVAEWLSGFFCMEGLLLLSNHEADVIGGAILAHWEEALGRDGLVDYTGLHIFVLDVILAGMHHNATKFWNGSPFGVMLTWPLCPIFASMLPTAIKARMTCCSNAVNCQFILLARFVYVVRYVEKAGSNLDAFFYIMVQRIVADVGLVSCLCGPFFDMDELRIRYAVCLGGMEFCLFGGPAVLCFSRNAPIVDLLICRTTKRLRPAPSPAPSKARWSKDSIQLLIAETHLLIQLLPIDWFGSITTEP